MLFFILFSVLGCFSGSVVYFSSKSSFLDEVNKQGAETFAHRMSGGSSTQAFFAGLTTFCRLVVNKCGLEAIKKTCHAYRAIRRSYGIAEANPRLAIWLVCQETTNQVEDLGLIGTIIASLLCGFYCIMIRVKFSNKDACQKPAPVTPVSSGYDPYGATKAMDQEEANNFLPSSDSVFQTPRLETSEESDTFLAMLSASSDGESVVESPKTTAVCEMGRIATISIKELPWGDKNLFKALEQQRNNNQACKKAWLALKCANTLKKSSATTLRDEMTKQVLRQINGVREVLGLEKNDSLLPKASHTKADALALRACQALIQDQDILRWQAEREARMQKLNSI